MRILGIDPGLNGAAAVFDTENPKDLLFVRDLPTVGSGKQRIVDVNHFSTWLGNHNIDHAVIEQVSAMQGWGIGGVFRFAGAYYSIRTVVTLSGIPYDLITPQKWKKAYGLVGKKGKDKEYSRALAIRLFPKASEQFALKKDHQKAEAALIAKYGAKLLT